MGRGTFLPTSKEVTERPKRLAHRQQVWLTSLQAPGLTQAVGRRVGSWAFTGLSGTDSTVCMGGWGGWQGREETHLGKKRHLPSSDMNFLSLLLDKTNKNLKPPKFYPRQNNLQGEVRGLMSWRTGSFEQSYRECVRIQQATGRAPDLAAHARARAREPQEALTQHQQVL